MILHKICLLFFKNYSYVYLFLQWKKLMDEVKIDEIEQNEEEDKEEEENNGAILLPDQVKDLEVYLDGEEAGVIESIDYNEKHIPEICENFHHKELKIHNLEPKKICYKWMSYLFHNKDNPNITYIEARCKYLYYWLYYELKDKNERDIIIHAYEKLLNLGNDYNNSMCKNYSESLKEDKLEKLKDLHDMYTNINDIKHFHLDLCNGKKCNCAEQCANIYNRRKVECESSADADFCNILKKIRNELINLELIEDCEITIPEMIISHKSSKTNSMLISFVVTFVISFILFILYRVNNDIFTRYGSSLFHGTVGKKIKWNSLYEEKNILQLYEINNSNGTNRRCNILYNAA
ncbi:variable surface protein [Plasmodium gonderi]|uniref:Variable surface protein n=1 Tax=Plasmodium gonderi TaxID=77519 RepID=A0A1Y1JR13_PLAGO|nr:variable surface protein [Plasmodium gonderi]GAW83935.1 variable surface protein [Plasmodium gonderi]